MACVISVLRVICSCVMHAKTEKSIITSEKQYCIIYMNFFVVDFDSVNFIEKRYIYNVDATTRKRASVILNYNIF